MKLCKSCAAQFDRVGWQCPRCLREPEKIAGRFAFAPELAKDSEGFEADYFARLYQMEAANFWFRSRNRLLVWALRRYFPQAKNFLEIGCGTGFVLSGIGAARPELALSGSEIFSDGLVFAAERLPGAELFQMDARRLPFREEFDVIGAFDVLEHIEEDEDVLAQMYQATRPRGGILVTVPQHPSLWSASDDFARHVRRYKLRELREKAERAGFRIIKLTSFVSLLLPLLFLSRTQQRFSRKEFEADSEFKIGFLTNMTLEKVLDIERALIRSGGSFGAGGSLLLVADRD